MTESPKPDSPLAGTTILRFAHAFESGAGTERYLEDLDTALLQRNPMTIVRLHLSRSPARQCPSELPIGKGLLVRVPLLVARSDDPESDRDEHGAGFRLKQMARNWILYNPIVWRAGGSRWAVSRRLSPSRGQAIGAGLEAGKMFRERQINLVMLHFFGGADAGEVLREARTANVPYAVLNHYANDRYLHLAMRAHAMNASGVAGVNGLDVPRYLRHRFTNLSDGIDTEFFRRENARALRSLPPHPILILPARIVREKGQMDLVRAVANLRRSGIECGIAFAGRVDASGFVEELRREIAQADLTERVLFLGSLSLEELRDWYAASAAMVLPTYHHEGLPRVMIEAQAMGTPVVAYASGGVPDGIDSGKTGFLLKQGDISGLTRRLGELLSLPDLRHSMGAAGRMAVESHFSLAALAERHERFYTQVIASFEASSAKAASN